MSFNTEFSILRGNLVYKSELRKVTVNGSERSVMDFGVGTNGSYKDSNGEWKRVDKGDVTRATIWGKGAENLDNLDIGTPVIAYGWKKWKEGFTSKKTGEEYPESSFVDADAVGIDISYMGGTSDYKRKGGGNSSSTQRSSSPTTTKNTALNKSVDNDFSFDNNGDLF